eukprot:Sdes_comp18622_c0_seq1m8806
MKLEISSSRLLFLQYFVALMISECLNFAFPPSEGSSLFCVKWPNDIYSRSNEKLGGILCNSDTSYCGDKYFVVVGIGLNIFNEFPSICIRSLVKEKSSSKLFASISCEEIFALFLHYFHHYFGLFEKYGFEMFLERYYRAWLHSNQIISVQDADSRQPLNVKILGISLSTGNLIAADSNNQTNPSLLELHPDYTSLNLISNLMTAKSYPSS